MSQFPLDHIEPLEVDRHAHPNEIRALRTLRVGLHGLYQTIKKREHLAEERVGGGKTYIATGFDPAGNDDSLDAIACTFHWFGITLCNYARLVGLIRGLDKKDFTRADLAVPARHKPIKKSIGGYVDSISEIAAVKIWRNKVSAHPAITDPREDDNPATLDMSVIFPVSLLNHRYVVGAFTMIRKNATDSYQSELPQWSLTEVYEAISPRYWPVST